MSSPKTRSKTLWHFTGGPLWDEKNNCQMDKLKSPQTAFDNLCSILKSGQLRVGSYHEVIKLVVPVQKTYDLKTRKIKIEKNVPKTMATSAVCCLADIPITELFHHAK